jgi:tetratricopeptide (TPR) repeat protein
VKRRSIDPETRLKRAYRSLERGQYKSALQQFEKLLPQAQADPTLTEQIYLAMADACLSLRDLPHAISYTETAIELNPENEQAYYLLGFAHSVNQDWDQAVEVLGQAIALNPDEAEYYRAQGWALFNQDPAGQEGLDLLEKALHMAPTHLPTLTDLAMLYSQKQDFERALIYARRAAELAPSDPRAQEVLQGVTYFKQEFERLGRQTASKPPAKPKTEAEWRELIAVTGDHNQMLQLWIELHPAKNIDDLNISLQDFNELWNSTPRPELGGRSPNQMMGRGDN